jgi:hypothetical protein
MLYQLSYTPPLPAGARRPDNGSATARSAFAPPADKRGLMPERKVTGKGDHAPGPALAMGQDVAHGGGELFGRIGL